MNERSLYNRLAKELNRPSAIAALEIGTMTGRFVKPRDGFGLVNGKMVRIPNPVDFYWVTDSLELKAVKARTMKGMVFRPRKAFGDKQFEEMQKYNALLSIAFIMDGKDERDQLVAIYTTRFWKIERTDLDIIDMQQIADMSDYTIKGSAEGKVPG
jgi:hypothetical protein